jgi:hypothetical protein
MSRRNQQRPTVANPIFKKSLGDVIEEAARERREQGPRAPERAAPPYETRSEPAGSAAVLAEPATVHETPEPSPQADEAAASWPMPVSEFRKGQYLHSGDVVLTTKLGSLFSFFNRVLDASDFAHAALVFATRHSDIGVDESYLIETTFGGVELSAFGEIVEPTKVYPDTGRAPEYIVGIKRLEQPWASPKLRAMVSGRMLRFLDIDRYDYSMLAALASRHTQFWFKLRSFLFGRAPSLGEHVRQRRVYSPAEFICSGFVQFAFVDMVREAVERGHIDGDLAERIWPDVLLAPWVNHDTTMEDLMGVRPIELAQSDKLAWKYLIYGGEVHPVADNDTVDALLERIRNEHKERAKREA